MGFVSVASGTATAAIARTVEFSRGMSKAVHKKPPSEHDSADEAPYLEPSTSLDYYPSRNPVQHAAHYSPAHLDALAYQLASKTLPNDRDRKKAERTHSWSPKKRSPNILHGSHNKRVHYHGRLHDASVETGHFAYSMAATGLRSESLPISFPADLEILKDTTETWTDLFANTPGISPSSILLQPRQRLPQCPILPPRRRHRPPPR